MKKIAAVLVLAMILALSAGCTANNAAQPNEESLPSQAEGTGAVQTLSKIDEAEDTPAEAPHTYPKSSDIPRVAEFERGYVYMELPLYDGWEHDIIEDGEGIRFWKSGDEDKYAQLLYYDMFGVCGTGLKEESIELTSGEEANVGYYDGGKDWSFIHYCDAPGDYAATNCGLEGADAESALAMLQQAAVGPVGVGRAEIEQAVRDAAQDIPYDRMSRPVFGAEDGTWTVELYAEGADAPMAIVTADISGKVLSILNTD